MSPDLRRVTASLPQNASNNEPSVQALSTAGQMLVWSARRWVVATRLQEDTGAVLLAAYEQLGAAPAAAPFDECMSLLSLTANHPIAIRCLCSKTLSEDEFALLQVFRQAQAGDRPATLQRVEHLISHGLKRLFITQAEAYATILRDADLPLSPAPSLSLVSQPTRSQINTQSLQP